MPDFERVLDELSIDLAQTDADRQYAKGYIAGKNRARFEILGVVVVLYFVIALIGKL